ncbi:MAG: hypothetical protein J6X55_10700, partial [Victivallales bacterium]|nr:hypothetical protein [Victivallales bacterium]
GVPPVATMVKARIALALVDCATGDTVCGVGGQQYSRNYTVEQIQQDKTALYEGHFHAAAET